MSFDIKLDELELNYCSFCSIQMGKVFTMYLAVCDMYLLTNLSYFQDYLKSESILLHKKLCCVVLTAIF